MRIILASAHPYLPQIAGGAQSNMHEVAIALRVRGHQVTVVAGLTGAGFLGLRARLFLKLGWPFHCDRIGDYRVIRAWLPWQVAQQIVEKEVPDVVIVQSGLPAQMASAFMAQGIPTVVHFHNVELDDLAGMSSLHGDAFIANSQFTASRVEQLFGIRPNVIVPSFMRERYVTTCEGKHITLINPHLKKGLQIMLSVVEKLPDYSFLFVKSWTLSEVENMELDRAVARFPNLKLSEPTSDMRAVYAETKILVVPSVWEEAWGRVATEAQFSGIPVIGSDRGGIPEAIGPGGVVLCSDASADEWATTIRAVVEDKAYFESLSREARNYSERDEIDLNEQMKVFEQICENVISKN